jgi:hypothetical protein
LKRHQWNCKDHECGEYQGRASTSAHGGLVSIGAAFGTHPIELQAMTNEFKAKFQCDGFLERLNGWATKLNHLPSFHIDQMVMMIVASGLQASALLRAFTKSMALQHPMFSKQLHGAIHSGQRNTRFDGISAPKHFLDIGMIVRIGQNPRNDTPLPRQTQAILGAQRLDPGWL